MRKKSDTEELDRILNQCRKGKESAFEKLYYRFNGYLFTIARRYSKDQEEARDIVQNAFMRICKNLHQFRGEGSFEAWIKRILINEAIDQAKTASRGVALIYQEDLLPYEQSTMHISDEAVLAKLSYDELCSMVAQLPSAYRTVFTMYIMDGYKHHEIAKELGIKASTSKSNLCRAKALLVQKLKGPKNHAKNKVA